MSAIAELEARLAQYKATERDILIQGQKTRDEDERELQRANLATVQATIKDLEAQLALKKRPHRRTRQYQAKV